jgi:hypothetical protein
MISISASRVRLAPAIDEAPSTHVASPSLPDENCRIFLQIASRSPIVRKNHPLRAYNRHTQTTLPYHK